MCLITCNAVVRVSHRTAFFSEFLRPNFHPDSDLVFLLRRFSLLTRWSFSKPWWDCDLLCWSRTSWRVQVWVPIIKVAFSIIFVCARSALVPWTDNTEKKTKPSSFQFSHCSKHGLLHVYFAFFHGNVILGSDYPFPLGEHHPRKLIEDVYKDDLELRAREQSHSVSRFFFFLPLIKRRRRRCLNSLLLRSRNFATMVTWRHTSPLYKHWYRLITVEPRLLSLKWGSVISRFFSIRYTVTGAENIFQYTEDFVISSFVISRFHCKKRNRYHPSPQLWFLSQFAHSHPFNLNPA